MDDEAHPVRRLTPEERAALGADATLRRMESDATFRVRGPTTGAADLARLTHELLHSPCYHGKRCYHERRAEAETGSTPRAGSCPGPEGRRRPAQRREPKVAGGHWTKCTRSGHRTRREKAVSSRYHRRGSHYMPILGGSAENVAIEQDRGVKVTGDIIRGP